MLKATAAAAYPNHFGILECKEPATVSDGLWDGGDGYGKAGPHTVNL
jgi:hypothetical protein